MSDRDELAALMAHTRDVVSVLDESGRVQYTSPAVEDVLGYATDELLGTYAFDLLHPEDREETVSAFATTVETGEPIEVQHRYETVDGDWVWLESTTSGDVDEALDGYVVTSRDISERKRAERDRRLTHDLLTELTSSANDVLWMYSADWEELLFVNPAYEDIFGGSVETLAADPSSFLENVHPEDRERTMAAMERLSAGEYVDIEYRVNPAEDFGRWVWVQGTPIVEDGEVTRIVGFCRDLTERVEYRRQLTVMDRVLRHNLHNDMNVVLGYAELAKEADNGTADASIDRVIERGHDLLDTVAKQRQIVDLLDPVPKTDVVDLVGVTRATIGSLETCYPEATIEGTLPVSAHVEAVPEIDHAVEELLENAIKHSGEEAPSVRISIRTDGETVILDVEDDGPGIPEQEIGVLTEAQEVEPLYHGSGLGLWLVNWVVRRSDGTLSFQPGQPSGSHVTVELPATGE